MQTAPYFYRLVVWVLRRLIEIRTLRVEEGIEKVPETGGFIAIAPHLDEFDALIAPEIITRAGRMPRIFAKASLWRIPVVKQAFESGKLIPVERGSASAATSLVVAKNALENNEVIFIFPEGTCSKDPQSWPMTCKTGVARLALQTGVPVIPILQDGAQYLGGDGDKNAPWVNYFLPKANSKTPIVYLKVYDAIDFSDIFTAKIESPTDEQVAQVIERVENYLTQIVEEMRGFKAPPRWDPRIQGRAKIEASVSV
jgi:1-acyl-sn-glycerol-3-phosphate acyltransferase